MDTIPLVNHIAFEKLMKSPFSSYMIFVQDFKSKNANEHMLKLYASLMSFLDEHAHYFFETILVDLPPPRGVDDHKEIFFLVHNLLIDHLCKHV